MFDDVKSQIAHELQDVQHAKNGHDLLPLALLMCQLSQDVYSQDSLQPDAVGSWQQLSVCGIAGLPRQQYRALLLGSQLADPSDKLKRQYAIWVVPTVGFITAFRGTADFADVCTDLDFGAETLASSSQGCQILLHGGMMRGVSQTVEQVFAVYQKEALQWPGLPLFWTGMQGQCVTVTGLSLAQLVR